MIDYIQAFYHRCGSLMELSDSKCFAICMGCKADINMFDAEQRKEVSLIPLTKEAILLVIEQTGGRPSESSS